MFPTQRLMPLRIGIVASPLVLCGLVLFSGLQPPSEAQERQLLTLATPKAKPANADPKVKYIGSQQCIECHQEQHRSYLETTHSKAAEAIDVTREPEPASFKHDYSGHTYTVDHRDGKLWHSEIMRDDQGQPRNTTEVPITYSIGSGSHGKSYLYRDGEFWAQSPLSWFRETKKWDMSPGYERPLHVSFRRKVGTGCVFCHVGNIDRKEGNPYVFEIIEPSIGCERCHGPGELHARKYRENPDAKGPDNTIVNPVNLSRELSEAVCQQCHLQAAAKSPVTGKDEWDFRPGLPLTDIRVDYQYRLGDDTMKIVGHVEQMHMSECYKQTESLTCITCHNPHDSAAPDQKVEHYRSICLSCHDDQACAKPHEERVELADNSCFQCHMPKSDTDVVHAALHHHRIGIHDAKTKESQEVVAGLSPVLDVSSLSENERARCEALAKAQVVRGEPGNPAFKNYPIEAIGAMVQLKAKGVNDAELNAVLSWLAHSQGESGISRMLSREVLRAESSPTRNRIEALRLLAQDALQRRDKEKAVEYQREVAKHSRDATDAYFLGVCENNAGNTDAGIAAFKRSLEIDPSQEAAHVALQAILGAQGKQEESRYHGDQAAKNRQLDQRLRSKAMELMKKEQAAP